VMGARLMLEVLADPDAYPPVEQATDGVTHAAKIDKSEARLHFDGSALDAERQVRAFNPAPGAFFELHGERIKVLAACADPETLQAEPGAIVGSALEIACAEGVLIPTYVQRAGRSITSAEEMLRGFPVPLGTRIA